MEKQKEVKTKIEMDNYTIGNMLDSFLTLTPNVLEIKNRCKNNEDTVEFSNLYNLPCGILKHSNQTSNNKFYFDKENRTFALDLNFLPKVRTVLNLIDYNDSIYMFRGNSELLIFNEKDSIILLFPSNLLNYQSSTKTNSECFILDSELFPIVSFSANHDTLSNVGSIFLYSRKINSEIEKIEIDVTKFQKIKYKQVLYSDILKLYSSIKSKNYINIDTTKIVSPYADYNVPFWLR